MAVYGATCGLEAGINIRADILTTGNSSFLTAALIVADVVGSGILGISVAVSQLGWLPGVVSIVLLLLVNAHVCMLMWHIRMAFPEDVTGFMSMVNQAFSRAPEGQRKFMSFIAGMGQYTLIFTSMGIYVLSGGRALGNMFYDYHICLPTWAMVTCAIIVPFHANARRLGTWQSLIWMNLAMLLGVCLIPLSFMLSQGLQATRPAGSIFVAVADFDMSNTFAAISVISFSFTSPLMVVEIISEMKNPSQFPKAYMHMAAPFQAIAFIGVAIGGYYFVGDKMHGMIGDNIPFGFVSRLAALCLFAYMMVTYMVRGIVLCRSMHSTIAHTADGDDGAAAWQTWGGIVLFVALMAWLIASTVPFFNELAALVGALLVSLCCWLIPIFSYIRWAIDFPSKEQNEEHRLGKLERIVLMLELAVAAMLLVFGTYFAARQIRDKWDTFGPPFACHCQSMWNTCECSAQHAGMFELCQAVVKSVATHVNEMVDANFVWMLHTSQY